MPSALVCRVLAAGNRHGGTWGGGEGQFESQIWMSRMEMC